MVYLALLSVRFLLPVAAACCCCFSIDCELDLWGKGNDGDEARIVLLVRNGAWLEVLEND